MFAPFKKNEANFFLPLANVIAKRNVEGGGKPTNIRFLWDFGGPVNYLANCQTQITPPNTKLFSIFEFVPFLTLFGVDTASNLSHYLSEYAVDEFLH